MTPLRIDDIGASSKRWERHRGKWFPYRELTSDDLNSLSYWLWKYKSRCTLAVTACWVEGDAHCRMTPFDQKYPEQAQVIRSMVKRGAVEIACHGLTHCIPGRHLPSWIPWRGNRQWHREYIAAMPWDQQVQYLWTARDMLEQMFATKVTTLVPPGNAISERLALTAHDMGFSLVTCKAPPKLIAHQHEPWYEGTIDGVTDDGAQLVLHDRDLVHGTVDGVMSRMSRVAPFCTVADYYAVPETVTA